ncbi:SPOR domain-containing protein [Photobacterium sp. R1]
MKKIALMVAITSALAGCALDNERQTINGTVVPTLEEQEQAALAQQPVNDEPVAVEQMNGPIEPLTSGDIALNDEVVPMEQEIAPMAEPAAMTAQTMPAVSNETKAQNETMTEAATAAPAATVTLVDSSKASQANYEFAAAPETGFTVQVLGLSQNSGFAPYVAKLPGQQPVWINQKTYREKPWYTLLYGHFKTVEEAQAAIQQLPGDIQSFGPFVRSLAKIHQSPEPKLTKVH